MPMPMPPDLCPQITPKGIKSDRSGKFFGLTHRHNKSWIKGYIKNKNNHVEDSHMFARQPRLHFASNKNLGHLIQRQFNKIQQQQKRQTNKQQLLKKHWLPDCGFIPAKDAVQYHSAPSTSPKFVWTLNLGKHKKWETTYSSQPALHS